MKKGLNKKEEKFTKAIIVDCERLNLREAPNGDIKMLLPAGTIVKRFERETEEGWSYIEDMRHRYSGYVMTRYLTDAIQPTPKNGEDHE